MKFCKYKKTIMENKKIIEISISFQVVKFISNFYLFLIVNALCCNNEDDCDFF
jgi:hypothetical protein